MLKKSINAIKSNQSSSSHPLRCGQEQIPVIDTLSDEFNQHFQPILDFQNSITPEQLDANLKIVLKPANSSSNFSQQSNVPQGSLIQEKDFKNQPNSTKAHAELTVVKEKLSHHLEISPSISIFNELQHIHDHNSFSESDRIEEFRSNDLTKPLKIQNHNKSSHNARESQRLNHTTNHFSHNSFVENLITNKNIISNSQTSWIIDSGATIHMTNQSHVLTNYMIKEGNFVTVSDGSQIPIKGYGNLEFKILGDENLLHKFTLENVAHVPNLTVNLLSVRELTKLNVKISFIEDMCKLIHSSGSITIGSLQNNLYKMKITHKSPKIQSNNETNLCIHQWHKKLSHRNLDHIRQVKDKLHLKIQKCSCIDECVDCIKGKISALPFPKCSEKPKTPRSLVTSDLCGQFKTQSLGGAKYFITLIDAATDYTEVVTLKHKSDTNTAVKNFMEKCKTQFGHYPKTFRSDRGGEFLSADLQTFFKENGIEFQCTVPNTPQQNGISERKNRTLVEAIRTLLVSKNLPHYLWGEALHYANNTFNSIPKENKANSPKEEFFEKKIPFKFIEFGAPLIFHANDQNRSKLDPKGIQGIFTGIDHNSKGFRVFWNGKIIIKRIVKFINSEDSSQELNDSTIIKQAENESKNQVKSVSEDQKESFPVDQLRRSKRLQAQKSNIASESFEPKTYKQAISCPEKDKWILAMEKELLSIENNKTWSLEELPQGRTAVGCRWVFKIKQGVEENSKYKARLVAQGFTQKFGIDYEEVFAPVTRSATFRTLLSVASSRKLFIKQYDVKSAFLNGTLNEEIFMKCPPNLQQENKVLRLHKSLYGLKQAARVWNQTFHKVMLEERFIQSKFDECLYIFKNNSNVCYAIVHVDDMIFASNSISLIESKTSALNKSFELKCLGDVKNYLSIEVAKDKDGVYSISQTSYIEKVASQFGLTETKGSKYPLDPGYHKLEDDKELDSNEKYRKLIGMLLYISTNSRPDISAAVGILSQRVSRPRELDYVEALRIVKYLVSTKHERLLMLNSQDTTPLTAFADSDWAEERETRKSISGIICKIFGASVAWSSRKQNIVSTSTTESEFYALAESVKEVQWLRNILLDLHINVPLPITIHSDNQSTIKMIENSKFSARTKHIDVRLHFVRDCVSNGTIKLKYCPSEDNVADLLTKPLAGVKMKHLRNLAELKLL